MAISGEDILTTMRSWGKPVSRTKLRELLGGKSRVNSEMLHTRLKGLRFQGKVEQLADGDWMLIEMATQAVRLETLSEERQKCAAAWRERGEIPPTLPANFEELDPKVQALYYPEAPKGAHFLPPPPPAPLPQTDLERIAVVLERIALALETLAGADRDLGDRNSGGKG